MRTFRVFGLPPVSGTTAAERRQALLRASDGELAESLVQLARTLRGTSQALAEPVREIVQVPLAEMLASPFAFRISAMAAALGATTVHVESREVLIWPKTLRGEQGTRDVGHGAWDRGHLQLGKYQQFLQDEPLALYQPQHVSKWAPHELLHRVCGFFYRPGCSRWELYLGARLNELLPVVTWYGAEQTLRLDELQFDRQAAGRSPGAELERAYWLNEKPEALRARALQVAPIFRTGIQHFERELAAIDDELNSGRIVRAPHAFLDSSSDALAYVAGHFSRLETMGEALAELVPTSMRRYESVYDYREFIEQLFDELLFQSFEPDLDIGARLCDARRLWDVVHRGLQVAHRPVARLASEAGRAIRRAADGHPLDVMMWRNRVMAAAGRAGAAVVATGDVAGHSLGLEQLALGLQSCSPRTVDAVGDSCVAMLSVSDVMWSRAPLSERFARWLEHEPGKAELAELAWLEDAIVQSRAGDDRIERLCETGPLPTAADDIWMVRSRAFGVHSFEHDVLSMHAGEDLHAHPTLCVGAYRGEIAVVPVPAPIADVLEAMDAPRSLPEILEAFASVEDPRGWLEQLIIAGVLGWSRKPPRAENVDTPATSARRRRARASKAT